VLEAASLPALIDMIRDDPGTPEASRDGAAIEAAEGTHRQVP
jgi:hypothetical protein